MFSTFCSDSASPYNLLHSSICDYKITASSPVRPSINKKNRETFTYPKLWTTKLIHGMSIGGLHCDSFRALPTASNRRQPFHQQKNIFRGAHNCLFVQHNSQSKRANLWEKRIQTLKQLRKRMTAQCKWCILA